MDDSILIELVRQHPSIYNPKNHQYKDANVRDNVWAEIAALLQPPVSVEECKTRWKNIRDTYMRRKRSKKLPTGSARTKKLRNWHLEEHLVFLNLVECERETLTNTATPHTQCEEVDYGSQQTQNAEMEDSDVPQNVVTETLNASNFSDAENVFEEQSTEAETELKSNKRKIVKKTSADDIVTLFKKNSDERAKLFSTVLMKPPEDQQHPVDMFFKSKAMSVNKLSPENQIRAKMQICEIVGQLELGEICGHSSSASPSASGSYYDRPLPVPTTSNASSVSNLSPASMPGNQMQFMSNVSGNNFL